MGHTYRLHGKACFLASGVGIIEKSCYNTLNCFRSSSLSCAKNGESCLSSKCDTRVDFTVFFPLKFKFDRNLLSSHLNFDEMVATLYCCGMCKNFLWLVIWFCSKVKCALNLECEEKVRWRHPSPSLTTYGLCCLLALLGCRQYRVTLEHFVSWLDCSSLSILNASNGFAHFIHQEQRLWRLVHINWWTVMNRVIVTVCWYNQIKAQPRKVCTCLKGCPVNWYAYCPKESTTGVHECVVMQSSLLYRYALVPWYVCDES